jgi:hypothetical protein
MNVGFVLALAFGIGLVAGLRTFTAPAVTAWAAHLHWLNLSSSHLAFMGSAWAVAIFSLGVAVESVGDQLPNYGLTYGRLPRYRRQCCGLARGGNGSYWITGRSVWRLQRPSRIGASAARARLCDCHT